jgi:hypothetical protein
MHPFWKLGAKYKDISYPNIVFELIEETDTHVGFMRSDGIKHFVPKETRNIWMYREMVFPIPRKDLVPELIKELEKEPHKSMPEDAVRTYLDRRKTRRISP